MKRKIAPRIMHSDKTVASKNHPFGRDAHKSDTIYKKRYKTVWSYTHWVTKQAQTSLLHISCLK